VRTTLRRLQQLEQRRVEQKVLLATSDAKERLLARLAQMGERLRSDPNWKPPTDSEAAAIQQHLKSFFATQVNGR
jgi:hypothetical protein